MLEIQSLFAGYAEVTILKDVTLHVNDGEFVCLLGANSAGKSTLINCISRLIPPTHGKILFNGNDLTTARPDHIVNTGIVQVPEGRQVFPKMTVNENLLIGGINPRSKNRRPELIERVYGIFPRLKERGKQKAGTLSGGEQQMLAIGRALMAEPKILMLDEPSLGLAPVIVREVFDILKYLNQQGLSILLVEQNLNLSLAYASRGYVLERGEIVLQGPSEELKVNKNTRRAYLGM